MGRSWSRAVLKVVMLAAATCSGIGYAQKGLLTRDVRQDQTVNVQDREKSDETAALATVTFHNG